MTERPSPERLAEIRERAKFWGFSRHVDAAEAMMLLLAEIDALRAERDALRSTAAAYMGALDAWDRLRDWSPGVEREAADRALADAEEAMEALCR